MWGERVEVGSSQAHRIQSYINTSKHTTMPQVFVEEARSNSWMSLSQLKELFSRHTHTHTQANPTPTIPNIRVIINAR